MLKQFVTRVHTLFSISPDTTVLHTPSRSSWPKFSWTTTEFHWQFSKTWVNFLCKICHRSHPLEQLVWIEFGMAPQHLWGNLICCQWQSNQGIGLVWTYCFRLVNNPCWRLQSAGNSQETHETLHTEAALIARFMGPTWGPSGADRTQVGPMLAQWTLLSE